MRTRNVETPRKQKIFRFDEELAAKLSRYARIEGCSENTFVEQLIRSAFARREAVPHIEAVKEAPRWASSIADKLSGKIRPEDLEEDDRLKYLLER